MLEHVTRILVVEELEPVVEEQVERLARLVNPAVEILGKAGSISREGEPLHFVSGRTAAFVDNSDGEAVRKSPDDDSSDGTVAYGVGARLGGGCEQDPVR